jgi:hypothetical protein
MAMASHALLRFFHFLLSVGESQEPNGNEVAKAVDQTSPGKARLRLVETV